MSEKILEIKDERLSFFTPAGEVKALNGVSFSMNQGDVLGIVGESGSGKSVTAYSIMGLTASVWPAPTPPPPTPRRLSA